MHNLGSAARPSASSNLSTNQKILTKPHTGRETPIPAPSQGWPTLRREATHALGLAFTRYCHHQYCMVHGIQKGVR